MSAHKTMKFYRRWSCAALVIVLCFGLYGGSLADDGVLRGFDPQDGYRYLEFGTCPQTLEGGLEPILWRILSVDFETVFLVSEYVLFNHRIHYDDAVYIQSGGDFTATEMYEDLNGEFLTHFTDDEKAMMIADEEGGLVTLLSRDDLKNKAYGFTNDYARRGIPTPYALQNGLFQYSNGSSPYWTCTQSTSADYGVICTKENGNLGYIRVVVQNEGCRPAIYLNSELFASISGSGQVSDPFRVTLRKTGE